MSQTEHFKSKDVLCDDGRVVVSSPNIRRRSLICVEVRRTLNSWLVGKHDRDRCWKLLRPRWTGDGSRVKRLQSECGLTGHPSTLQNLVKVQHSANWNQWTIHQKAISVASLRQTCPGFPSLTLRCSTNWEKRFFFSLTELKIKLKTATVP